MADPAALPREILPLQARANIGPDVVSPNGWQSGWQRIKRRLSGSITASRFRSGISRRMACRSIGRRFLMISSSIGQRTKTTSTWNSCATASRATAQRVLATRDGGDRRSYAPARPSRCSISTCKVRSRNRPMPVCRGSATLGSTCPTGCEIASKGDPTWEYIYAIDCAGEFVSWVGSRFGATRDPAKFGSFTTRSMRCEPAAAGSTLRAILHRKSENSAIVFGMVERGGIVRAGVVKDVKGTTLEPAILTNMTAAHVRQA
jgi:hypothetical protein